MMLMLMKGKRDHLRRSWIFVDGTSGALCLAGFFEAAVYCKFLTFETLLVYRHTISHFYIKDSIFSSL